MLSHQVDPSMTVFIMLNDTDLHIHIVLLILTMLLSSSDADFHMYIILSISNTYILMVTEHQVHPLTVSPVKF